MFTSRDSRVDFHQVIGSGGSETLRLVVRRLLWASHGKVAHGQLSWIAQILEPSYLLVEDFSKEDDGNA